MIGESFGVHAADQAASAIRAGLTGLDKALGAPGMKKTVRSSWTKLKQQFERDLKSLEDEQDRWFSTGQ